MSRAGDNPLRSKRELSLERVGSTSVRAPALPAQPCRRGEASEGAVEAPSDRLPGDDVVAREDEVEEAGVIEISVGEPAHADGRRQSGQRRAVQEDDGDLGTGLATGGRDDVGGQGCRVALEEMQEGGHQKTMKREARDTSAAMSSGVTGTTACPSVFQSGSSGSADPATWNAIPSFLSEARYLAMSSPSTSSSVSSSSRWIAGPASTMSTSFSPATTPSAMRIASLARWEMRGTSEMMTTVGWRSATVGRVNSLGGGCWLGPALVQRQEPFGAVDEVGQHHEAAVGGLVGERLPALLATVRAHEELQAAPGQRLHPWILDRGDGVVDEVEVYVRATVQRGPAQSEGGLEVGVIGRRRDHEAEFSSRQVHHALRV